jgi:hypothetical protein
MTPTRRIRILRPAAGSTLYTLGRFLFDYAVILRLMIDGILSDPGDVDGPRDRLYHLGWCISFWTSFYLFDQHSVVRMKLGVSPKEFRVDEYLVLGLTVGVVVSMSK